MLCCSFQVCQPATYKFQAAVVGPAVKVSNKYIVQISPFDAMVQDPAPCWISNLTETPNLGKTVNIAQLDLHTRGWPFHQPIRLQVTRLSESTDKSLQTSVQRSHAMKIMKRAAAFGGCLFLISIATEHKKMNHIHGIDCHYNTCIAGNCVTSPNKLRTPQTQSTPCKHRTVPETEGAPQQHGSPPSGALGHASLAGLSLPGTPLHPARQSCQH